MKLSHNWLKEFVANAPAARELGDRLTMVGFELESIQPAAADFSGVIVATIERADPHPQADKLRVCQVNTGSQVVQIVCGASNAREGLRCALATVGAKLPGDINIRAAKLRGVESHGMLCSAKELGLAEDATGLLELPADAASGMDLREYLALEDYVLEFAITPNRGDAMSMLGLAREVVALDGSTLTWPDCSTTEVAEGVAAPAPAQLLASSACSQFCSRILVDVDNSLASPIFLQERLRRAGLRSISPIVDITNYILLELGQPMHAYDLDRLQGPLQVRFAADGESIELLDGRSVSLQQDILVIADDSGPVAMAGVMGGSRTAVSSETRRVLFEVASFRPAAIAGRARRFGLTTDASQRFERGVDPALAPLAIERATRLLQQVAGGRPSPAVKSLASDSAGGDSAGGELQAGSLGAPTGVSTKVSLRVQEVERVLGISLARERIIELLGRVGMVLVSHAGDPRAHGDAANVIGDETLQFTIPSYRFDITIERDLLEELARLHGFENIPAQTARAVQGIHAHGTESISEQRVLDRLAGRGFHEGIHFAFVDPLWQEMLFPGVPAYRLGNPIAADLAVMRLSLWPGLLRAVRENQRRQQARIRLFELGVVFPVGAPEERRLAAVVTGPREAEHWSGDPQEVDFFDLRGDLESLFQLAGADDVNFQAASLSCLHPGRSAQILRGGRPVGWLGQLHPKLTRDWDLASPPTLFEIQIDEALAVRYPGFVAPSRFPAVRRDLAVVVEESVTFEVLEQHVKDSAGSLLQDLTVFDVYRGQGVEAGRKSIALGLILQDKDRTLTDPQIEQVMRGVRTVLEQTVGARVRE
jgi:phenylalanyl-tRNA synthetase beta chain